MAYRHLIWIAVVAGVAAGGAAAEPGPAVEELAVSYPQADRMATVRAAGTEAVPLPGASFDARFDTLTVTGTWCNATPLIFRPARLEIDLLAGGRVRRSLLAGVVPVFRAGQREQFTLMIRVSAEEGITAVRPRITVGAGSYQEEHQRNAPRVRGI